MSLRFLALAAVLATSSVAAEEFKCKGAFAADSSAARLAEIYGADNVVTGPTDGPEGSTINASVVFPDDVHKMMTFVWWDEGADSDLSYVELPDAASVAGLAEGMSVAEVEALNGAPFTLAGFWWDYGGYADFTSGRLAQLPGGCLVSVTFYPTEYANEGVDVQAISGEKAVPSSEPLLVTVAAELQAITLSYPLPLQ
ncbi:hypothetical protein [Devosia sp. SL43]|uniref:hypothetical protein n=1 Tax=Devosia sp. SL43 TaxID=2806348 RepID=UPI001F37EE91|nr:hypothetical protein [Devosia sp. SL43]UJW84659.1 hypothetical protein IM737_14670 [Devosia sp. SL43]